MCFGGSPQAIPLPAPAPQAAQGDAVSSEMAAMQRQRAAASNTTLTSSQGVQSTAMMYPQTGKSLIGA
jgi:hypothetical protein